MLFPCVILLSLPYLTNYGFDASFCQSYFGLKSVSDIPELVGTMETSEVPFSSISILKRYSEHDMTYKMFSRSYMEDDLLDIIFR